MGMKEFKRYCFHVDILKLLMASDSPPLNRFGKGPCLLHPVLSIVCIKLKRKFNTCFKQIGNLLFFYV